MTPNLSIERTFCGKLRLPPVAAHANVGRLVMPTEIEKMVSAYLDAHPGYEYPESGDRHPAVLAAGGQMKPWIIAKTGVPLPFWRAMLESAREWFPQGSAGREFRLFCYFFEAEGNTWWEGRPEFEALAREYNQWCRGVKSTAAN